MLLEVLGQGPTESHQDVALGHVKAVEVGRHIGAQLLGFQAGVVEDAGLGTFAWRHESSLVVGQGRQAKSLDEASAPRPLLARGPVTGTGHDLGQGPKGLESRWLIEAGSDYHVLVGEGQDSSSELLGHKGPKHGVSLGGAVDGRHANDHGRGPSDALQRAERESLETPARSGSGDQHPLFGLLRDQAEADRIYAELLDIQKTQKAQKAESSDPASAFADAVARYSAADDREQGGALGWSDRDSREDHWTRALAFVQPVQRVSPPFRSPATDSAPYWELLWVDQKEMGYQSVDSESVRYRAAQAIAREQMQQRFQTLLADATEAAALRVNQEVL